MTGNVGSLKRDEIFGKEYVTEARTRLIFKFR